MDNVQQQTNLTSEEKLLALLSHLSIFFAGIILPIILWAVNKDKSKFVTFHSLQALFFHIAYGVLVVVLIMILVIAGMGIGFLSAAEHVSSGTHTSVVFIVFMVLFYGVLLLSIFGVMGYSVYMGIKAHQGELKKYPIIGNIVYKKVYGIQ